MKNGAITGTLLLLVFRVNTLEGYGFGLTVAVRRALRAGVECPVLPVTSIGAEEAVPTSGWIPRKNSLPC